MLLSYFFMVEFRQPQLKTLILCNIIKIKKQLSIYMYFLNVIYSCDGKADFGVQESFLIIINVEYKCAA